MEIDTETTLHQFLDIKFIELCTRVIDKQKDKSKFLIKYHKSINNIKNDLLYIVNKNIFSDGEILSFGLTDNEIDIKNAVSMFEDRFNGFTEEVNEIKSKLKSQELFQLLVNWIEQKNLLVKNKLDKYELEGKIKRGYFSQIEHETFLDIEIRDILKKRIDNTEKYIRNQISYIKEIIELYKPEIESGHQTGIGILKSTRLKHKDIKPILEKMKESAKISSSDLEDVQDRNTQVSRFISDKIKPKYKFVIDSYRNLSGKHSLHTLYTKCKIENGHDFLKIKVARSFLLFFEENTGKKAFLPDPNDHTIVEIK